jgi:putative protein kinase ArgK-like GTPase of G3E family
MFLSVRWLQEVRLGGLSAKTIEMTDVLKASGFDHIIVETVGVGQSEVEIAGLADNLCNAGTRGRRRDPKH